MTEEVAKTEKELRPLVRIIDVDVDGRKSTWLAMTKVKGVSFMFANAVCSALNIPKLEKVGYLTEEQIKKIEECMQNPAKFGVPAWLLNRRRDRETGESKHIVGPTLKLRQNLDIRFMKKTKSVKGIRHARGIKVRGQRTRTTGRKGGTLGVIRKKQQGSAKKK